MPTVNPKLFLDSKLNKLKNLFSIISGQNKNNYFIWYLLYRIMAKLHTNIEYSFMSVGHTKFACDQNFGVLKRKTNKTELWTLYDIATAVNNSGKQ